MAQPKKTGIMQGIEALQIEIAAKKEKLDAARDAWPPIAEAHALADSRIDDMATDGKKHLDYFCRGLGQFGSGDVPLLGENCVHADAIFAALNEAAIRNTTRSSIEKFYSGITGEIIPSRDKPAAIARLEKEIFALEVAEEKAIEQAEESGLTVQRRADASPEAILGLSRGEKVPHSWRSVKADRLMDETEASRARIDAARQQLDAAQRDLVKLKSCADVRFALPADEVAAIEERIAYWRGQFEERMAASRPTIAVACRIREYLEGNRLPRVQQEPVRWSNQPRNPENWAGRYDPDAEATEDGDQDLADQDQDDQDQG